MTIDIAIPIFDGLTALDAIGPYEVLSRVPGARVHFLALEPGAKRTDNRMLALTADEALSEMPHSRRPPTGFTWTSSGSSGPRRATGAWSSRAR